MKGRKAMRTLRIEYPTGYMEFVCDALFPFTLKMAKQLFKLINEYCSVDVKMQLKEYLTQRAEEYKTKSEMYSVKSKDHIFGSKEFKHFTIESRKAATLYKRTIRNLEMLEVT